MPVELRKRKAPAPPPEPAPAPVKRKTTKPKATAASKGKAAASKAKDAAPKPRGRPAKAKAAEAEKKPADEAAGTDGATNGETVPVKPAVGSILALDDFGGEVEFTEGGKTTLKQLVDESKTGVVIFTYPKASTPGCKFTPFNHDSS